MTGRQSQVMGVRYPWYFDGAECLNEGILHNINGTADVARIGFQLLSFEIEFPHGKHTCRFYPRGRMARNEGANAIRKWGSYKGFLRKIGMTD